MSAGACPRLGRLGNRPKAGSGCNRKPSPGDSVPPARPYLLNTLQSPKTSPGTGDRRFTHEPGLAVHTPITILVFHSYQQNLPPSSAHYSKASLEQKSSTFLPQTSSEAPEASGQAERGSGSLPGPGFLWWHHFPRL